MGLKTLEVDIKIGFVEHILDAMMKPVGYLCILGVQYVIGRVFRFL